ncbi:hypothetical protein GJ744_006411 [Endocarpon pusillum]|uniref:Uncharacterized protein n=1 Tax=Endocarpon pusillum TaxID=364733 RepID=A0A8H7E6T7_9EURO|nr:hypothetical protein GJ744_006411 [Endocarpon pusillum]
MDSRSLSPVLPHFDSTIRFTSLASPPSSDIELVDTATTSSIADNDLLQTIPVHIRQAPLSTYDLQMSDPVTSEKVQNFTNPRDLQSSPVSKRSRLRRATGTISRIQKAIRKSPVMATRSRKVARFYQLGSTGVAVATRNG